MSYNEQETRFHLINPVLRDKGYNDHQWIRLETPAPVEPTGPKGRRRKGSGRTDYLLCVQVGEMSKALPVGVLEAKKETEDPLKGMQQAKGYADCRRFEVKYVFATNGHLYGEFDFFTNLQEGPFPLTDFSSHPDFSVRYARDTGIDIASPEAAMLFQTDSPAWSQARYYQVAAIRAAFEKIIRCRQQGEQARVLLSLATGSGKTIIATNLLWRLSQAGQLPKPALFLCDRDELREPAYTKFKAAFGDYILTNPPFGGKEDKDAQKHFAFETGYTQVLFLQDILSELAPDGTCAIVLDEGLLFRTNESAFVETRRKLVGECDLWAIISLPGGVFSTAGAGVKTNLLFFTKGRKTKKIWYYDLSDVKVGKKTPLTLAHYGLNRDGSVLADSRLPSNLIAEWREDEANAGKPFPSYAKLLDKLDTARGESRYSWTVDFAVRRAGALEEIQPLLNEAAAVKAEVVDLQERFKRLKKELNAVEGLIRDKEKAVKDLEARAAGIDAAVFDLKAVNPNAVTKVDERTPQQIIGNIEQQGWIISEALDRLTRLLAAE